MFGIFGIELITWYIILLLASLAAYLFFLVLPGNAGKGLKISRNLLIAILLIGIAFKLFSELN